MPKSRSIALLALATLLSAAVCWSQETRGSIVGKVTDPSGALIAGANVVVTNTAMGTKTTLTTNGDGYYQATYLIPGTYQVDVASPGFKKAIRGGIEIRIADRIEVNIPLELGDSQLSITVHEETPLLNSETAPVGSIVDSKRVADLPLSYGNPFELIGSAAGVAFTGDARPDRPFEPTHIVGYAMGGSRGNLSDVTLDGAPTTATANANQVIASYVPPTDIVQEFKVQTTTFDAQFGQTMGGVTNISLKAGANAFHGTAGYTMQRASFWANDFFRNSSGQARPDFNFDRWGGSFGGPVWIPKVYNGKNKTFFMWATRAFTIPGRGMTMEPTRFPPLRKRTAIFRPSCWPPTVPVIRFTIRSPAAPHRATATRKIRSRAILSRPTCSIQLARTCSATSRRP
jgi:hypothetical protein